MNRTDLQFQRWARKEAHKASQCCGPFYGGGYAQWERNIALCDDIYAALCGMAGVVPWPEIDFDYTTGVNKCSSSLSLVGGQKW